MTSDLDKEKTDKWCQETETAYAYGYDVGGKLERKLGGVKLPSAVLVGPDGRILYNGHPTGLTHALIAEATKDAVATPLWENAAAKDVLVALRKNELGNAWAAARRMGDKDDGVKIAGYLQGKVAAVVYTLYQQHKSGDFLACLEGANIAANSLVGTPDVRQVHRLLEDLAQDDLAQNVIEGQLQLRELMVRHDKVRSKVDATGILEELEAIIVKFPDSIVATQGNASADALAKRLKTKRG